jgi:heme-degrading monooxygenase HmoA
MFEVHPHPQRFDGYLQLAGRLKPLLERIEGFLDNERFESRGRPGWLLSHSTWRDEKSLVRWRTQGEHRQVQERGRAEIFQDYRLRVGEITADSAPPAGLTIRNQRLDETEVGAAKLVTFTEVWPLEDSGAHAQLTPADLELELSDPHMVEYDVFTSIYTPGKSALLVGWRTAAAGEAWRPRLVNGAAQVRHRCVRVVREYGMFDRRETPQFHAPVQRQPD